MFSYQTNDSDAKQQNHITYHETALELVNKHSQFSRNHLNIYILYIQPMILCIHADYLQKKEIPSFIAWNFFCLYLLQSILYISISTLPYVSTIRKCSRNLLDKGLKSFPIGRRFFIW